jgi:hypothetical protein
MCRLCTCRSIVEGGAFEVPDDKLGVHSLWGETVVFSGSARARIAKSFRNTLKVALLLFHSAQVQNVRRSLSLRCHTILCAILRLHLAFCKNPRFADDDFNLLKKRVLQEFARRDENPAKWAALGSTRMFWGGTAAGRYATIRTVNGVKRERYRRMAQPHVARRTSFDRGHGFY